MTGAINEGALIKRVINLWMWVMNDRRKQYVRDWADQGKGRGSMDNIGIVRMGA